MRSPEKGKTGLYESIFPVLAAMVVFFALLLLLSGIAVGLVHLCTYWR